MQANGRRHCGRVRAIRKFLSWLHVTHQLDYPQSVGHCTEYLRMRLSDPCKRGALKTAHHALVFLNELTGTQPQDWPTSTKHYPAPHRELLATALPGRPYKQAPRMFVSMLRALGKFMTDLGMLPFVLVYAWWMLVQNWATLRFSDHRGIDPGTVVVSVSGFSAVFSRSRTIGADKSVGSRPLTIAACCYLSDPAWIHRPSAARAFLARLSAPQRQHPA